MSRGVIEEYDEFLPTTSNTPRITLGEGNTPLVKSQAFARELGLEQLYFKLEGCNPTGSFKDRGMVVAVANAIEEGNQMLLCASTGNTSASAAAYGAHCNLTTVVLVPKGRVARGKLAQAIAYGAHIMVINGNFDQALDLAREISRRHRIALVNSVNPYRLEGQKTAPFEIIDALGDSPDIVCIPVGNAGNITAYWKGFTEYLEAERSTHTPQMFGFQAEGAAPIVHGQTISDPQTIASAIRIGNPASWEGAVLARDESGGLIESVTDEEILEAYKLLARNEGIFCEPASAASLAGLTKMVRQGMDLQGKKVVCIITGNGLKDPELAEQISDVPLQELTPDLVSLEDAMLSFLI
ncbi:threonine synthase [SAR202 cluster bacterium AD-802-E10_MRT_200m]|nr:threonine synthase [SAR202 cluster bacterium AD-802-E10_MRT_200m]